FYSVLFLFVVVLIYVGILFAKFSYFTNKLKTRESESDLLLTLIQGVQKQCFVDKSLSINEYYDALSQFETRLVEVSEVGIEYETKKSNLFKLKSSISRLKKEKAALLDKIKKTQQQYFELGLIETRIYEARTKSLTKKLSQLEEEIVSKEYTKDKRLKRSKLNIIWNIYYKIFG
ncbi:MAG: hypothetical protein PHQ98_03600, partial [Candidatus ainarchaeum sp.]|nr:hypothetical protein [Candidatus ainarchaeum sp.]